MKKKCISLIIILALIICSNSSVWAITSSDYKDKVDNTEQQLEDVNKQLDSALQEVEDLSSSIDNTEQDISKLTKELGDLNTSIKEKEEDLSEKQELLEERLVASYINGKNTYLDALFSGGFTKFISNYESIKQIAEYDTNLMNEVKDAKTELEAEKEKIQTLKTEKENKSQELKKLKSEKQEKVNNLTDEQKSIQSQLDEYNNQMKILEQKEKAQAEKEAEEKNKKASSSSSANNSSSSNESSSDENTSSSGRFLWPVPASHHITSPYGYRIHPIYGTKKLHAGIDIGAPGGSNILAGDSGTVMLASFGYNGGYGNYVIINHGNGVTTRYAHCSNLLVSTGQQVTKGQAIATVGSTGASTGNHCHFEVRISGQSKNPINYL